MRTDRAVVELRWFQRRKFVCMNSLTNRTIAIIVCASSLVTGCESSRATQDVPADVQPRDGQISKQGAPDVPVETPKQLAPDVLAETPSEGHHEAAEGGQSNDIDPARQFFASRVEWPGFDANAPVYVIESGSNKDGAWFEGKGFFRLSSEDILRDMGDPMIMGPSNVTQNLSRRNSTEDAGGQRYDLHVEMSYIMTVEFDLTVQIHTTGDVIHYESHKTAGTSMIKRIDEIIDVHVLPGGWCSVAFQSRYDALVVKEKETRNHFEELFARWAAPKA